MSMIYGTWQKEEEQARIGARLVEQDQEIRDLKDRLKIMTEDRDEYRVLYRNACSKVAAGFEFEFDEVTKRLASDLNNILVKLLLRCRDV